VYVKKGSDWSESVDAIRSAFGTTSKVTRREDGRAAPQKSSTGSRMLPKGQRQSRVPNSRNAFGRASGVLRQRRRFRRIRRRRAWGLQRCGLCLASIVGLVDLQKLRSRLLCCARDRGRLFLFQSKREGHAYRIFFRTCRDRRRRPCPLGGLPEGVWRYPGGLARPALPARRLERSAGYCGGLGRAAGLVTIW
jgi:hypothetical protein